MGICYITQEEIYNSSQQNDRLNPLDAPSASRLSEDLNYIRSVILTTFGVDKNDPNNAWYKVPTFTLKNLHDRLSSVESGNISTFVPEVTFLNSFNSGRKTTSIPSSTNKWIRIAQSPSNAGNNFAIFEVRWTVSGQHGHVLFSVGANFGDGFRLNINVLSHSFWGATLGVEKIRVLEGGTYDQMYIEIYVRNTNASSAMSVEIRRMFGYGWELIDVVDGSIPSGYLEHAATLGFPFRLNKDENTFLVKYDGNIGSGTIDPKTRLHLHYGGSFGALPSFSSRAGILQTWDSDHVFLGLEDSGSERKDAVLLWGDNSTDFFRIKRHDSSGTTYEYLTITGSGNVGINNTSPSEKLHVGGNLKVDQTAFISNRLIVGSSDFSGLLNISGNNHKGIVLQRQSSSTKKSEIIWTSNSGENIKRIGVDINNNNTNNFYIWDDSTSSTHFFISESGDVGVGTTLPSAKLDVIGDIKARTIATTIRGRFGETSSSLRYLLPNPNKIINSSGELGLEGWTVTSGGVSANRELDSGIQFESSSPFEMYTDVAIWRGTTNYFFTIEKHHGSGILQVKLELYDGSNNFLNTLYDWTNVNNVLNLDLTGKFTTSPYSGYVRIYIRSTDTNLKRFRNIGFYSGLPGLPIETKESIRWLYDNTEIKQRNEIVTGTRTYRNYVTIDGNNSANAWLRVYSHGSVSGQGGLLFAQGDSTNRFVLYSTNTGFSSGRLQVFYKDTSGNNISGSALYLGNVSLGVGILNPSEKIETDGNVKASRFISTVSTGTAPLQVSSTTLVTNLNSDLLDGYHATDFPRKGENATITGTWTFNNETTFSSGSYISKITTTVSDAPKWLRIAQSRSSAGNNFSLFEIRWTRYGVYGHLLVSVGANYGQQNRFNVNVLSRSAYTVSGNGITKIRILDKEAYDQMYIEIYVENGDTSYPLSLEIRQLHGYGWSLITPTDGSIPSGYTENIFDVSNPFSVGRENSGFVVNYSDNVGIGISSPSYPLHIAKDTNNLIRLRRTNSSSMKSEIAWENNSGAGQFVVGIDLFNNNTRNFYIYDLQSGRTRLFIDSNGYVGINNTSPSHFLDISTGFRNIKTYQYGLEVTVNTSGGWAQSLRFRNENDNKTGVVGGLNGGVYLSSDVDISSDPTGSASANILFLNTSGNVGIGTTSPSEKLDVRGNIVSNGYIQANTFRTNSGNLLVNARNYEMEFRIDEDSTGGDSFRFTKGNNGSTTLLTIQNDGKVISNYQIQARNLISTEFSKINKSRFGISLFSSGNISADTYVKIYEQDVPSGSTIGFTYIKVALNGHNRNEGRALVELFISGRGFNVQSIVNGYLDNDKDIIVYHNTDTNKYEVYLKTKGWTWYWEVLEISSNVETHSVPETFTTITSLPNGTVVYSLQQDNGKIVFESGNLGLGTKYPNQTYNTNTSYQIPGVNNNSRWLSLTGSSNKTPVLNIENTDLDSDAGVIGTITWTRTLGQSDRHRNVAAIVARQVSTGNISGSKLEFWTKDTASPALRMLIDNNGRVGIGNTSPTEKLDVSGNVKASRFISTVSTGTPPLQISSTTVVTNLNSDLLDGYHATDFPRKDENANITGTWTFSNNTSFNRNITTDNNNVVLGNNGIYTANNWKKGLSLPLGYAIFWPKGSNSVSYGIGAATNGGLYFITSGADDNSQPASYPVVLSTSGNLGIGTASPSEKLDVNGNIKLNGAIIKNGYYRTVYPRWGFASNIGSGANKWQKVATLTISGNYNKIHLHAIIWGGRDTDDQQVTQHLVASVDSGNSTSIDTSNYILSLYDEYQKSSGSTIRVIKDARLVIPDPTNAPNVAELWIQWGISYASCSPEVQVVKTYSTSVDILMNLSGDANAASTSPPSTGTVLTPNYLSVSDKLSSPRTISLSGDVAGSVSFDGSSDVTISASVTSNIPRKNNNETISGTWTFNNTIIGNASTADKWRTARTISLSGDVTGSASVDGSSNAVINTTIVSNIPRKSNNETITGIWNFSNNLGIGVSPPSEKLEINGNIKLSNSSSQIIFSDTRIQNIRFSTSPGPRFYKICDLPWGSAVHLKGVFADNNFNNRSPVEFDLTYTINTSGQPYVYGTVHGVFKPQNTTFVVYLVGGLHALYIYTNTTAYFNFDVEIVYGATSIAFNNSYVTSRPTTGNPYLVLGIPHTYSRVVRYFPGVNIASYTNVSTSGLITNGVPDYLFRLLPSGYGYRVLITPNGYRDDAGYTGKGIITFSINLINLFNFYNIFVWETFSESNIGDIGATLPTPTQFGVTSVLKESYTSVYNDTWYHIVSHSFENSGGYPYLYLTVYRNVSGGDRVSMPSITFDFTY